MELNTPELPKSFWELHREEVLIFGGGILVFLIGGGIFLMGGGGNESEVVVRETVADKNAQAPSSLDNSTPTTLSESSEGNLWINVIPQGDGQAKEVSAVFQPEGSIETYEIFDLTERGLWYGRYFIADDRETIYSTGLQYSPTITASSIEFFNVFTKEVGTVPNTRMEGEYITSMYLDGETITYLVLEDNESICLDTSATCITQMYQIQTDGTQKMLVTTDISGSNLEGYDSEKNEWYISETWGDAGACVASLIRIGNDATTNIKTTNDCSEQLVTDELRSTFSTDDIGNIYVKDGRLEPGEGSWEEHNRYYFPN